MAPIVYVFDEMVAHPGKGRELLEAYKTRYVPGALARGMVLDRIAVSPPMWLDDASNRITATWTVAGPGGWWGQAVQSRFDPSVGEFWQAIAPLVLSRARHFGANEADVQELSNV